MGTTRSLRQGRQLVDFAGFRDFNNCSSDLIMIYSSHFFYSTQVMNSLLLYVLKLFGILAGRCGSVVVRERD